MDSKFFKSDLAYENWQKKYQFGDEQPIETFERIAKALASIENNPNEWKDKFLKTLVKYDDEGNPIGLKCTPGGRITANAGTTFGKATLMNCFINGPVRDAKIEYVRQSEDGEIENIIKMKTTDSPDDLINIFLTIMEQAKTLASEGGYGINFGFIRPRGALIKGTGIRHPGVVSYMDIWDSVSECIVKGDNDGYTDTLKNYLSKEEMDELTGIVKKQTRKGAMLGALPIWHPDIEEFIRAKQESGRLTKFNISVLIDDKFMEAVANGEMYDLHFDGKVYKRVKAKKLYDLIMKSTYNRAEPGVLFYDNMKKNNPIQYLGDCNCTNPSLRENTLILTDKGIFPIKDLSGQNIKVMNFNGEFFDSKCFLSGKNKTLYKITFNDGTDIYCTPEHKWPLLFSRRNKNNYEQRFIDYNSFKKVETKDLKIGSKVYHFQNDNPIDVNYDLSFNDGFLVGWNIGDGWKTFHKQHKQWQYGFIVSDKDEEFKKEKGLPKSIWQSNNNFIKGIIDGLFSSDGSIIDFKRNIITLTSSHKELVKDVQMLLNFYGIRSKIFKSTNKSTFPNGKNYNKLYTRYDLKIFSINAQRFAKLFHLSHKIKNEKLNNIKNNDFSHFKQDLKYKIIKKVEKTNIQEDVYDITVYDNTHTLICEGGIVTSNCGEIPGNPYLTTVCLLGSINLTQYVFLDKDKNPHFDWEQYIFDIKIFTRMLDNVNDLTTLPLPSYEWAVKNNRQFGMGLNGLGSTLLMMGIKYGSEKSLDFIKELVKIKENITIQTSALLAKEKGTFPLYDAEKYMNTSYFKSDRLDNITKELVRMYGVRNAKTTTNPPLGNTSVICGCSNGIEPIFSLETERKVVCDWPEGMNSNNVRKILNQKQEKDFVYWEGEYEGQKYYYEPHNRGLCEVHIIRDYGFEWFLENFSDVNIKDIDFVVSTRDLEIEDHLNVQEVVQYYCNQSVSKTCNLPKNYSFTKFKGLYIDAWKRGLVGFTTYREGSMESVLSTIEKAEEKREIIKKDIKLPEVFINGPTTTIKREGMKFYINFSYLPDDKEMKYPVAFWIHTNAKKETVACNRACKSLAKLALGVGINQKIIDDTWDKCLGDYPHNRLARMISLCMRHNIPREDILVALTGIEGDNISTLLTAVRKFIGETIDDGKEIVGMSCSECGETLVMESGCFVCKSCGNSKCGG